MLVGLQVFDMRVSSWCKVAKVTWQPFLNGRELSPFKSVGTVKMYTIIT